MESALLRVLSSPVDDGFVSLLITCVLFLLTIALVVYKHHESLVGISPRDQNSLPPGNDGLPFLGETLLLASQKDQFFRKRRAQFGAIYRTHLFGCPAVRVTGEEGIRQVLAREGRQVKSYYPSAVRRLLGNNSIVTSYGDEHHLRKRQLTRYLSHDYLQTHLPLFSTVVSRHLDALSKQEAVDIYPACKAISVELALRFLLHVDVTASELDEIRRLLTEFTDNLFSFPLYLPGTGYYKAWNVKKQLMAIIEKHLKRMKTSKPVSDIGTDTEIQEPLEHSQTPILETGNIRETLEELFELLFVGADNNGSGMFVIVNQLSRHPEVVMKARRELEMAGLIETADHGINLEEVRSLLYIRAVVKECLRLMPPVGGVYRTATEAFEFKGYHIPEGWRIIAGIRETHENDPGLDEPLTFDPDRWLRGDTKPTFLTFGAGSRMCPGKMYADLLMRVFVVELIRQWDVEIVKDSVITMFPAVKPKDSLLMRLSHV